jgi:hypothetical protein
MLTIQIRNDGTGTNESANYDYTVYVNSTLVASGRIESHNREDGWRKLLQRLVQEEERWEYA